MRTKGKVKWFNDEKGFGFIVPDGATDDSQNAFVGFRHIQGSGHRTLTIGQVVEFDVEQEEKGLAARNVTVVA